MSGDWPSQSIAPEKWCLAGSVTASAYFLRTNNSLKPRPPLRAAHVADQVRHEIRLAESRASHLWASWPTTLGPSSRP